MKRSDQWPVAGGRCGGRSDRRPVVGGQYGLGPGRRFRRMLLFILLTLVSGHWPLATLLAHESPIDHIDRTVQIFVQDGKLHLSYRFRCEERQVMLQLLQMDKNGDGKISDAEREAWFREVASNLVKQLHVEVDGRAMELEQLGTVRLDPDLSQTYEFVSPIQDLSVGEHKGLFTDEFSRAHPGQYKWSPRQINANGIDIDATEAPGLELQGSHPAMIVINLKILVRAIAATQPATKP